MPLTHGLAGAYVMTGSEDRPPSTIRARPGIGLARRAYLGAVMVSGSLILCWSAVELIARPPGALWLVLAGLTVASALATVRLPGFPISFSLSVPFDLPSGPAIVAVSGVLAILAWVVRLAQRR